MQSQGIEVKGRPVAEIQKSRVPEFQKTLCHVMSCHVISCHVRHFIVRQCFNIRDSSSDSEPVTEPEPEEWCVILKICLSQRYV